MARTERQRSEREAEPAQSSLGMFSSGRLLAGVAGNFVPPPLHRPICTAVGFLEPLHY